MLENELLSATVLVEKGADVYELRYKPKDVDVLCKTPWGLRDPGRALPSSSSETTWLETYGGGWQELFPSGGGPCTYKGVELNFHGEVSLARWEYEVVAAGGATAELRLSLRLARSPFRLERTMIVEAGKPVLRLRERATNEGGEPISYMWGHHPAFGSPFLSEACRLDVGARSLHADDSYDGPHNPLEPGRAYEWPLVESGGEALDLSRVPAPGEGRHLLAYFSDFESGWYALTNSELGFGVGLAWPLADFPYAWFWQEMHASPGFPWYRSAYVLAVEPNTSFPAQGLTAAIEKTGTARTLEPGESTECELCAVFYEARGGVARIEPDGNVVPSRDA